MEIHSLAADIFLWVIKYNIRLALKCDNYVNVSNGKSVFKQL